MVVLGLWRGHVVVAVEIMFNLCIGVGGGGISGRGGIVSLNVTDGGFLGPGLSVSGLDVDVSNNRGSGAGIMRWFAAIGVAVREGHDGVGCNLS